MNGKKEYMNQVAVCPECKGICGIVAVTGMNKRDVATHMRDWGRKGYVVKYTTNSYVRNHRWGCTCEPHLPTSRRMFNDEAAYGD